MVPPRVCLSRRPGDVWRPTVGHDTHLGCLRLPYLRYKGESGASVTVQTKRRPTPGRRQEDRGRVGHPSTTTPRLHTLSPVLRESVLPGVSLTTHW